MTSPRLPGQAPPAQSSGWGQADGLTHLGVAELLEQYEKRTLSPVEAVTAYLGWIDQVEPRVRAFTALRAEQCLQEAAEAERNWTKRRPRPLEGVPVGLKDSVDVAGIPTTGGSRLYSGNVPGEDAGVVTRLKEAGALVLGKLQTTEFGGGRTAFGNPWDMSRTASGSSAGPAIALAAREVPLAIGTDTGGSIRAPAAFCGVSGLKPTYGLVSRYGVMPMSWTLDHVGPMARSARDIGIALNVLAGHDRRDAGSVPRRVSGNVAGIAAGVKGKRLGMPKDWFWDLCDPEVESNALASVDLLREAGMSLVEVDLPRARGHDLSALSWFILAPELSSLHQLNLSRWTEYEKEFAQRVLEGRFVNALDYIRALRLRQLVQADYQDAFGQVDALITPGAVCVAPPLTEPLEAEIGDARYPLPEVQGRVYHPFNIAGLPAMCLPSGFDRRGLPTSVQIVTAPFQEAVCLRVAHALQRATSYHLVSPPGFSAG